MSSVFPLTLTKYFWPENFCNDRRVFSVDRPRSLIDLFDRFEEFDRPLRTDSLSESCKRNEQNKAYL